MELSNIQIAPAPALQLHAAFQLSLPQSVSTIPYDSLDVEYQFEDLRRKWHSEYGASSSPRVIANSSSYRQIVFMGDRVLPLIFRDLEQRSEPDHWFTALHEITNANPVSPSDRGNMRAMAKAWIKWAKTHGYTW
jgi:hypothetical protein